MIKLEIHLFCILLCRIVSLNFLQKNMTHINENDDFMKYAIEQAPAAAFYIPEYFNDKEEEFYTQQIYSAPAPKWTSLSARRLQNYGGIVGKKGLIQVNDIPFWLRVLMKRVCKSVPLFTPGNEPNHVLINEYLPGQGIMPHTDGPAYFPVVANITLGSHTVLDLYETETRNYIGSFLLERRSLLIISEQLYTNFQHGIKEVKEDEITEKILNYKLCSEKCRIGEKIPRKKRISITIRNVPKKITAFTAVFNNRA
ncbi:Alpha-ketoglutarate-dependent dioxygenase alkB -like protein 6 [Trichinella pseudospiralis]|uniref:Alpha-ketoglutarate-dependent dioxygenase alkB-like protein 6 n=1 Tax=Trichinella pseudospiralis TaxID=6337 RepID=A0A0V1FYZ2_TRIPS|nr:Alpha-ketoglutarate-dependent dioxygenase alkB -like protein 6 [Trichinella pseudospiralis]